MFGQSLPSGGAQGIQGIRGPEGPQGIPGKQGEKGAGLVPFSTDEQLLEGVTWLDGSPVYQITHTGTTGTTLDQYNDLDLTVPDMDMLLDIFGIIVNAAGSRIPNNFSASGNFSFCVSADGVLQEWHNHAPYSGRPYTVTLIYTKKSPL